LELQVAEHSRLQREYQRLLEERQNLLDQRQAQETQRLRLQCERHDLLRERVRQREYQVQLQFRLQEHRRRLEIEERSQEQLQQEIELLDLRLQDARTRRHLQEDLEGLMRRVVALSQLTSGPSLEHRMLERRRLQEEGAALAQQLRQQQETLRSLERGLQALPVEGAWNANQASLEEIQGILTELRQERASDMGEHLRLQQEMILWALYEAAAGHDPPTRAGLPPSALRAATKVLLCRSDHVKNIAENGESDIEQCMVCLESLSEGELLRQLPCQHSFHVSCIDPWLLERSGECPVCRRSVAGYL
jgi:hypothetical protein